MISSQAKILISALKKQQRGTQVNRAIRNKPDIG